jgi:5'(3')-deoxyribonucleotidase
MSQKPSIAIDIDDVVAQSTEALRLHANERAGANLTQEHYRVKGDYWGYYERVWQSHGIGEKVSYVEFERDMEIDQSHIPLLPGASFALRELAQRYHIVLITARNKSWEKATRQWFRQYLRQDDIELYFCESHKDAKAKSKGALCRDLGASLLIDDNPDHCQTALDHGIKAILFGEYGWHRAVPDGAVQCKDWPSVMEYLEDDGR